MEVKCGEGSVVVGDGNGYSDECCNNGGWGWGWGGVGGGLVGGGFGGGGVCVWEKMNERKGDMEKVECSVEEGKGGIQKEICDGGGGVSCEVGGVCREVEGVGKEVVKNGFGSEGGVCDVGYKSNCDMGDCGDEMGGGLNGVMEGVWEMEDEE